MKGKSLSRARLLATPWTTAYQAPPSMGFSRQEYWSGEPLPSPEEVLQIAEKRIEAKGKGERKRHTQLNTKFQRRARRDRKALNEQCKEIEENNRMGKTSDLLKKTGDVKGTFHAMMGMINDRNGRGLTEAEEIKKKWLEYTEELNKKRS